MIQREQDEDMTMRMERKGHICKIFRRQDYLIVTRLMKLGYQKLKANFKLLNVDNIIK